VFLIGRLLNHERDSGAVWRDLHCLKPAHGNDILNAQAGRELRASNCRLDLNKAKEAGG